MHSRNETFYPSGWLYVGWLACIIYFFWVPIQMERRRGNLQEQVEAKSFPDYSLEELTPRAEKLHEAMEAPATDPHQFYSGLVDAAELLTDLRRYSLRHDRTNEVIRMEAQVVGMSRLTSMTRVAKYEEKFGRDAMRATGEEVSHGKTPFAVAEGNVPALPRTDVNWAWLIAYLQSVLLAPLFYYLRLRREGMRVAVEIGSILALMWVWPVAILYYPTWIDVEAQARRAKLWAAYAFSALVSLLPFGSMAKAQQGGGAAKRDGPAFVLQESFRSEDLNYPGVRVNKNAVSVTEARMFFGEWDVGIQASWGLGKRQFLTHHPGNEVQLQIGWRKRWREHFETSLRAAYSMNDFPAGGIGKKSDDQILLDGEACVPNLSYVASITPCVAYRYFAALGPWSPHSGSFWKLVLKKRQPIRLFNHDVPLTLEAHAAFSDGALGRFGKRGGFVWWRLGASWQVKLSDNLSLIPHLILQVGEGAQHGRPRDYTDPLVFVYGLSVQRQW